MKSRPISQADYLERITKERRFSKPNTEPSLTVPDQSMTIAQIMNMFQAGVPPIQKEVVYNDGIVDETKRPDYDLVDAHSALKEIDQKLKDEQEMAQKMQEEKDAKRRAKDEDEKIAKAVEERLKGLKKPKKTEEILDSDQD